MRLGVPPDGSPSDILATHGLFSRSYFHVGASLRVVAGERLVILLKERLKLVLGGSKAEMPVLSPRLPRDQSGTCSLKAQYRYISALV